MEIENWEKAFISPQALVWWFLDFLSIFDSLFLKAFLKLGNPVEMNLLQHKHLDIFRHMCAFFKTDSWETWTGFPGSWPQATFPASFCHFPHSILLWSLLISSFKSLALFPLPCLQSPLILQSPTQMRSSPPETCFISSIELTASSMLNTFIALISFHFAY